ncbi:MAG TPA: replicative DNA helicase [Chloroflexota bacterium]|nr:replicative DNA helicase [Chloroflexota bacterium]
MKPAPCATGRRGRRLGDGGHTLPHSLDAERSVLGALLVQPEMCDDAAALLEPSDFYRDAHGRIFRCLVALRQAHSAVDFVTVREALLRSGELDQVGGPAYLASLTDGLPRGINVPSYAAIVREHAILRGILFASSKAQSRVYEGDEPAAAILEDAYADLHGLASRASASGFVSVADLVPQAIEDLESLADPRSHAWGLSTSLPALDRALRGLRPGRFVVFAARPSVGKTSLAMTVGAGVAIRLRQPVGVFSLEMGRDELTQMLVCAESQVNIEDLADGKLTPQDWTRFAAALDRVQQAPIYIDDGTDLNILTMHAKARRLQREHGLAVLIVDYLQLMQGRTRRRNSNREEELSEISRGCKLLAKDLGVPLIVLSQLNRASEAREDKRPQLADLRGSGSIEQDADTVVLIHRPDMYPPRKRSRLRKTAEVVEEEQMRGVAELIVAKNRGLRSGDTLRVMFRKEYTRFEPLAF